MTDWESLYRSGETGWDKGAPAPALVEWLAKNEVHGRWLVPGCGRGHDVKALMEAGAEVLGLDIAPSAVEDARKSGVSAVLGDLFALPAELVGAFDGVFEHTCFCAIPRERRSDYVQAVHSALKPEGVLLALFYLSPRDNPDPTLGPPFNTSLEELDGLFSPYFALGTDAVPAVAYEGREGRERLRLLRKEPLP
jgi:SAM-dependent methyltransferase